jgi:hypothetical protein
MVIEEFDRAQDIQDETKRRAVWRPVGHSSASAPTRRPNRVDVDASSRHEADVPAGRRQLCGASASQHRID